MKSALAFMLIVLASMISISSCFSDGIITLDEYNFAHALSQSRFVVVEFFNSQCNACQRSTHEFSKTALKLSLTHPHVKFFVVDGSVEPVLAAHYNVQIFPAIKLFIRGSRTSIDYPGDANHRAISEDIAEWVLSYTQYPSVKVQTQQDVQRFKTDNNVVGLFLGERDTEEYKQYLSVAEECEDVVFIDSNNEDLRAAQDLKKGETAFIMFKKFDEGHNRYTGAFSSSDLHEFVKLQKYPTAQRFGQEAMQKIFYEGEDAIFLIKRKGQDEAVEQAFRKAALALKGEVTMTIVDYEDAVEIPVSDIISVPLNKLLVVTKDDLPAVRLLTPRNKMRRYGLKENVTVQTLKSFYENAKQDKVKPLYVSAPIEEQPYDGEVRKVVSKDFDEVVIESNDNVLVLFCNQHYYMCRQFELIYKDLAVELKADGNNIALVKVDTSSNEIEGVITKGGLEIRLYLKGSKSSPIQYNDYADKTVLKEFVEDHTMRSRSETYEKVFNIEK